MAGGAAIGAATTNSLAAPWSALLGAVGGAMRRQRRRPEPNDPPRHRVTIQRDDGQRVTPLRSTTATSSWVTVAIVYDRNGVARLSAIPPAAAGLSRLPRYRVPRQGAEGKPVAAEINMIPTSGIG